MSKTPTQPSLSGSPAPHPPQPPAQSSGVAYPPPRGVTWKCISPMMRKDKSCPGYHYNHPKDYPQLKFHQYVGCPELSKHGYLFRKDITASAKGADKFNTKFPKIPNQSRTRNPVAKRVSDNQASDHVSARRVHYPSISNPHSTPACHQIRLKRTFSFFQTKPPKCPPPNGYAKLYSSDSEDEPVFE